jgi:cytoskeleton protein RodZ
MTETELESGSPEASAAAAGAAAPADPAVAAKAAVDEADSFGRALAAARQARGLSQADVAAQLRLRLRQVQAIEAENLEALPESAFVRGFVRNYARLVELPAGPLLASLSARLRPPQPLPADGDDAGAASPVRLATSERLSRLAVVGGAVTALLIFALLGWWTMRTDAPARVAAPVAPAASTAPAVAAAAAATAAPAPPHAAAAPPAAPTAAVEPPAASDAAASAAAGAAHAGEPGADTPIAGAPLAPTALRFTFRDRSWVEVRQGDGGLLLSQTHEAGTQQIVRGKPPYSVVIGNASQVDLEFRGKPVDLAPSTSPGNVARLRLE